MNFSTLTWIDHPKNPLIKPPFPEWIIADPTVLLPDESPDGKWHLFAHGLIGLYHYKSFDGLEWKKADGWLSLLAIRPFIFVENKTYYLFYEKMNSPYTLPLYNSHLELISSTDLIHWTKPIQILKPTLPWHKTKNRVGNIGNCSIVKTKKTYRLYYSSGLTSFNDVPFCEPCYQGVATSSKITGPYKVMTKPILKKTKKSKVIKSTTKVRVDKNIFYGLQTLITTNPITKLSTAALHFSFSQDGLKWTTDKKPLITTGPSWKQTHVYVGSFLKKFNGQWRIYYNARNSRSFFGKECIGLAISK